MKNLVLTGLIMLAVIFGCNLSPEADFKPQGWRPAGGDTFQNQDEKIAIIMQGGFYDESGVSLKKDLCIGTNLEKPANVLLESVVFESGGQSYPGTWENNTTLNGKSDYSKNECGHIVIEWKFDRSKSEIFKQGAVMAVNVRIAGHPEQTMVRIVPRNEYKVESNSGNK